MANFPLRRVVHFGPSVNLAERYGVRVQAIYTDSTAWRAIYVRHLEPSENGGNHHIYIDTLDEQGRPMPQSPVFSWNGMRPDETPSPLEFKNESGQAMYNIPVYGGQEITVWLPGDSDRVTGLHTSHPIEGDGGNHPHHHSFYIVFQRAVGKFIEQPKPHTDAATLIEQAIKLLYEAKNLL